MSTANIETRLQSAVAGHRDGQLDAAEAGYRSVLEESPGHPHALHLLGVLLHQRRRDAEALELIDRAIAASPESWDFHCNRSLVLEALGRGEEAVSSLRAVAARTPHPGPRLELAFHLEKASRLQEAADVLHALTEEHPGDPRAWSRLGSLLQQLGRREEAEAACREAAALAPTRPEVLNNLATAQRLIGKLAEAEANAGKAIELRRDYAPAWDNLGQVLSAAGDVEGMFDAFFECARLRHPATGPLPPRRRPRLSRLRHDGEQLRYLMEAGLLEEEFRECISALESVCRRMKSQPEQLNPPVEMTRAEQQVISRYYDRLLVNLRAPAIDGGALNPTLDLAAIEHAFLEQDAPYVVVDDFLKPEAVESLYEYGLFSTVFFKDYENGYLTTKMTDGFRNDLLVQLVQEIPRRLRRIFADATLKEAWIFKCDSRMKALETHADFAAVNVNIWLTPDSANLDPESGGLTIFDRAAPADWSFETYNSRSDLIARYLDESGASERNVHYRHNRALIFRSSLFHRSEAIHFREGYENRRQNLTLLYGHRQESDGPATA